MKQYVYQLSLRKADDEKKKFIIESDIIFVEEKITQNKAEEISKKNSCDVHIQFIGTLTSNKTPEKPFDVAFHTSQDIEDKLNEWRKPVKEQTNESNSQESV